MNNIDKMSSFLHHNINLQHTTSDIQPMSTMQKVTNWSDAECEISFDGVSVFKI